MAGTLTQEEFSQHVHTKFRVKADAPQAVELYLVEVKGYESEPASQGRMERFSVFFSGPSDYYLPQKTYSLEHDRMGAFDIFLVPIARDEEGYNYEAVFNYFK